MMNVKMSGPTKALLSIYTSVILPCVFTVRLVVYRECSTNGQMCFINNQGNVHLLM